MSKFDFEPELSFNPQTMRVDYCYRPYLFIKLLYKRNTSANFIKALVDSGSDRNTFPAELAKEIRLDYKKGEKRKTTSVNDSAFVVYGNRVKVKYDGGVIETVVYFGENVKLPILGRDGFFNYFRKVAFDVKDKTFELVEK